MFDPKLIRNDFPILSRQVHGKPLVYLDNAATTQKPHHVIEALRRYYEESNANVHRGIHTLAEEATALYEQAREQVAHFIHAPSARSIVFTRGSTEAINLVAQAWGRWALKPGDEILLTEMEHHANLVPWQLIAQATGATLQFVGLTADGTLDLAHAQALLSERTKLFAVTHISNVLGTINPVADLIRQAHAVGALVLVDGAQSVPHLPVDVQELDCDFLVFSGHKMLGPTGIGVLYGRPELLEAMPPFQGGGEMISNVWLDHATWNEIPWKFEAGTPHIAGAVGLGAAMEYLSALDMAAVRAHEQSLVAYALSAFERLNHDIMIYGPKDPALRGGVIAFNYQNIHPHDVGQFLDGEGVAIRAGHHCAKPLMRRLGVVATARASFYLYNTTQDADRLIAALQKTKETFSVVAHR
ncbi:MAG: cysteine desulfurase [Candidatus Omnitrophica bacterium]|nr:cysteine desulfurase [Candidatus Omnitrophota bacterium]